MLHVTMTSLEVGKPGGSLSCVTMVGLEVGKLASSHIVCDDDELSSLEVYKCMCCV